MADLLQKVYLLFVRPTYTSSGGAQVVHKSNIYVLAGDDHVKLLSGVSSGTQNSPVNLNGEGKYANDPWFLHSSYTSYEKLREELKSVIAKYGTDNVRCAIYIPIDYSVIPNE